MTEVKTMSQRDRLDVGRLRELAARHGVTSMRLFGSVARGEDGPDSDFDFLVTFEPGRSLFDLVGLKQDLEEYLRRKVDVVTPAALSAEMLDEIRAEAMAL